MYPLKQSTGLTIPIFVHDANGDAVTGLVDAGFTKRISKNGAAFAAMTVTITEMENGWYSMPISTSHSNTLGVLSITLTHASSKQVNLQFRVHTRLPDELSFPTVAGRSIDVTTNGNVGIDWGNIENPGTTVDLSATDINLVDTTTSNTDMRGTDSALLASSAPANFGAIGITATGAVSLNWGDVENQATSVNLSSTTTNLVNTTTANTDMRGTDNALLASSAPTNFGSISITGTGAVSINWGDIENPSTVVDLAGTDINLVDTTTANTDMRGTDSALLAASAPSNFSDLSIAVTSGLVDITQTGANKVFGVSGLSLPELSQSIPSATPRPDEAIMLLYMGLRNQLDVDASFKEIHNDAGTVITKKALSDDSTTYSEAKAQSGP